MCGEHSIPSKSTATQPGSSPRVRGTRRLPGRVWQNMGIIPACAGNTFGFVRAAPPPWDHPRVCGEHKETSNGFAVIAGSSPRVRGTPPMTRTRAMRPGIIPACAGNTPRRSSRGSRPRDHPRVCGEHSNTCPTADGRPGSSPRVRGTRARVVRFEYLLGIIPACAGNTFECIELSRLLRDHPRVCGEHGLDGVQPTLQAGSSPRVRGTPLQIPNLCFQPGIIPACAGNTERHPPEVGVAGDHPRVCGEHIAYRIEGASSQGSSPRVRGTQRLVRAPRPEQGIIPACAGNTRTVDVCRG